MAEQYYIRLAGRTEGPFDAARLQRMRLQGRLSTIHQVSTDGLTWHPAATVPGVFGSTSGSSAVQIPDNPSQQSVSQAAPTPQGGSVEWYFATPDGQQQGPFEGEDIQRWLDTGHLPNDTPLWCPGMADWTPAHQTGQFSTGSVSPVRGARHLPRILQKGRGRILMIACAVFLMIGVGIAALNYAMRDQRTVAGLDDQAGLSQSVGLVIVGITFERGGRKLSIPLSTGTGFLISPNGDVVTNRHVIEGPTKELKKHDLTDKRQIWVFFGRDRRFVAQLAHLDTTYDLAVLKTEYRQPRFLALAKSPPKVGEKVHAIGFPGLNRIFQSSADENREVLAQESLKRDGGYEDIRQHFNEKDFIFSATSGTVSRIVPKSGSDPAWIEHSANINPGNSGGPLIDSQGRVLGINTLGLHAQDSLSSVFLSFTVDSVAGEIRAHAFGTIWK